MKRTPVLVIVLILACTSSAGCLNIDWVRSSFMPPFAYQTIILEEYTNITYTFNTDPQDPDTLVFNTAENVEILEDSIHIDVVVRVQLDSLPTTVNLSEILDMLGVEREVTVSLFKPDGKEFVSKAYNATTPHPDQWSKIPNPEPGTWRMVVRSEGVGHSSMSYHDNFSIVAVVRTPVIV